MQPEETDKPVRFYMDYYDAEHYDEKPRVKMDLYEDDFESCPWPLNLGKEIVLDEGVELSDADVLVDGEGRELHLLGFRLLLSGTQQEGCGQ